MSSSTPQFEVYERIVRDILEAEIRRDCPGAQLDVFHNRTYRGKSGNKHQIDVSAEIRIAGMQFLILAECKLYSRKKVNNEEIQVLASRIEDIGAHKGLFVTSVGFQSGAVGFAKSKGIALFVKNDLDSTSWRIVLPGLLVLLLPRARAAAAGDSATRSYSNKTSETMHLQHHKRGLRPFDEGTFGILAISFRMHSEQVESRGEEWQEMIVSTLNAIFRELAFAEAKAKKLQISQVDIPLSHDNAREIGIKYNAHIVIWGDLTVKGLIPNITLVRLESKAAYLAGTDTKLRKDSPLFDSFGALTLPPLTDGPAILVSYLIGVKYFDEGISQGDKSKTSEAANYFTFALSKTPVDHIDNVPILVHRALKLVPMIWTETPSS